MGYKYGPCTLGNKSSQQSRLDVREQVFFLTEVLQNIIVKWVAQTWKLLDIWYLDVDNEPESEKSHASDTQANSTSNIMFSMIGSSL
jgi:hypothetical protein